MEFTKLKKEYGELEKKYELPSFKEINENFEIDKLDKDTDYILRAVRKIMMEKVVNSMGFLEMLINPVNAPRMYLSYVQGMDIEDRKAIDKIYSNLADLSVLSLDLEIDSSEKEEGVLIKKVFKMWVDLKPSFRQILANMKKPKNFVKKNREYFG